MKNYCGHQILLGQWYLGPLLICMWTLAWSYKLDFKLHLVYPLLALMHLPHHVFPPLPLCFPVHTLYISSPKVFSNPEKFTHFFLLLSLVSGGNHHSFPTSHIFPCLSKSQGILTSLKDSLGTCSSYQRAFGSEPSQRHCQPSVTSFVTRQNLGRPPNTPFGWCPFPSPRSQGWTYYGRVRGQLPLSVP